MGAYIQNFNIPECCYQCFNTEFAYAIGCYKWVDMKYKARYEGRAKDCPLVEVKTPHGDLVDHSEIGKILIKALDECEISEADKSHVLREVWIAPTVIEGTE